MYTAIVVPGSPTASLLALEGDNVAQTPNRRHITQVVDFDASLDFRGWHFFFEISNRRS